MVAVVDIDDVVVKFFFTATRLRSYVRLLSYLPSPILNSLKLTQVSPSELSLRAIQSSLSLSVAHRLVPSLVMLPASEQQTLYS